MNSTIEKTYKELLNKYEAVYNNLKSKQRKIAITRLVYFLLGSVVFYFLLKSTVTAISIYSFLWFVFFLPLLRFSSKISDKKNYYKHLVDINKHELNLIDNNNKLYCNGKQFINPEHNFTYDLDIFGKHSIFDSINRTSTFLGTENLASWFNKPFLKNNQIIDKQKAVKELSTNLNWIQDFIATGLGFKDSFKDLESINIWLNNQNAFIKNKLLSILLYLLPALSLVVIILSIFGIISPTLVVVIFITNLIIVGFYLKHINKIHSSISKRLIVFNKYSKLIRLIEEREFISGLLIQRQNDLNGSNNSASKTLKKIFTLGNLLDTRLNIIVGVLLNGFLLWDLQIIDKIEKYKQKYKSDILNWFSVLKDFDAYISLAIFAHNNPESSFPKPNDKILFDTKDLGHPLINEKTRIGNEFIIRDIKRIKIVTGANMAGKSTFLRSVGVNLVLAMIGSSVSAKELIFKPIRLFTSMRTSDDLSKQVSYFHAELLRLKMLKTELESNTDLFIILDEILKGTNSVDKEQGSKAFLEEIINYNVSGLVATHDLSLGNLEQKQTDNFENYCFEIEFENDDVIFDYKLRKGITQKMNASYLMKKMGLIKPNIII